MQKKVVLITGSASGIGLATTKLLLRKGFIVYGGDVQFERMQNEIEHENFHPLYMDVSNDESVFSGVKEIIEKEGRINCLFSNVGYCLLGPAELQTSEDVINQFNVNVVGVGRTVKAVLPYMREIGGCRIVITSSAAGRVAMPCMTWYPATKHALEGYADGLRMELKDFKINVSIVEPGYIKTGIGKASFPSLDKAREHPEAHAYDSQMKTFRKKWGRGVENGAHPDTIAHVVYKAFTVRKPKRRYHPNIDAESIIFIRRVFGFWLVDKIIPRITIK